MIIHPPSLYIGLRRLLGPVRVRDRGARHRPARQRVDRRRAASGCSSRWLFLSIGNALGMLWAYEELGWGGYWAWDPVENAAFLPLAHGDAPTCTR